MKKLVATAPRVAALVEYEDRAILSHVVKIRVRFGAPKHGTEVVDFRAASPFIDARAVRRPETRNGSGRLPRRQPVYR